MVDGQTAKKTVFATGIGNAMEWFDFVSMRTLGIYWSEFLFASTKPTDSTNIYICSISNCLPITTNRWDSVWNHW